MHAVSLTKLELENGDIGITVDHLIVVAMRLIALLFFKSTTNAV